MYNIIFTQSVSAPVSTALSEYILILASLIYQIMLQHVCLLYVPREPWLSHTLCSLYSAQSRLLVGHLTPPLITVLPLEWVVFGQLI